jgi:hypothetical protein
MLLSSINSASGIVLFCDLAEGLAWLNGVRGRRLRVDARGDEQEDKQEEKCSKKRTHCQSTIHRTERITREATVYHLKNQLALSCRRHLSQLA